MIKREPDGCYMVVSLGDTCTEEELFALRMIQENRIVGLLPMHSRMFNGRQDLYYEIDGMRSLEAVAKHGPLRGPQLRTLLADLYALCLLLPEYFLSPEALLLSEKRIWSGEGHFYFCYGFPERQEKEEQEEGPVEEQAEEKTEEKTEKKGDLSTFSGMLLGLIDHDDEEAVVLAYQFYKAVSEGGDLKQGLEYTLGGTGDPGREEEEAFSLMEPGEKGEGGLAGSGEGRLSDEHTEGQKEEGKEERT